VAAVEAVVLRTQALMRKRALAAAALVDFFMALQLQAQIATL
jgi:hypothetical protein